jgi:hypothetical protein
VFERISNSFALARSSWGVLRTDKKLVLFPILSGIACVFVLLSFAAPFLIRLDLFDDLRDRAPWALGVIAFAFYFCSYFVIIFFNAALVSCALIRFHGGEPTLGDGLRAAAARLPQIVLWALVSATVGLILKAIENAHEKVGEIVSAILGTVWTVMTYFVVPVLVVEKVGPFAAIGRSVAILKKTWGEALVGHIGIGLFLFLLSLPGILLLVLGVALLAAGKVMILGAALLVLGILYLLLMFAVGAALQNIFVSALYHYAETREAPSGFETDTMRRAFTPKGA